MVDTDRNNVRFVATVDSIIVRFHARYCSFHPTEKEYIEICLCLSILWHFWYGKVNYDTSSDNINCESSLFNLISSETYHFLTKSTPCNLRKRTSRRCRISIMRILGWHNEAINITMTRMINKCTIPFNIYKYTLPSPLLIQYFVPMNYMKIGTGGGGGGACSVSSGI